ncbi:hypothetical protein MFIFM68171_09700 [Madurella fahalii]|uniref:Uncharacterized protein n=1 Tax=Madurella fahalii TaxID=1157608 RepID=A0ABQ0GP34_9PEZI
MSVSILERIERDLDKIGEELWNVEGSDDALDKIFQKLSSLKAQAGVQKSLQATANLLRRQSADKALPKQQATKVKHLIRFVFRKESRGGARHKQLRVWDCDALKFLGLSYSTEEIVRMDDAEFEILQARGPEFFRRRELSHLLYRPDVDKAVDAKFENPDDDGAYDKFIQEHTTIRLQMRKRKYDDVGSGGAADNQGAMRDKAGPSQSSAKEVSSTEPAKYGDVFGLSLEDAQYALSSGEKVTEIFLTNPWAANELGRKPSFLTAWLTEDWGELLSKRGKQIKY